MENINQKLAFTLSILYLWCMQNFVPGTWAEQPSVLGSSVHVRVPDSPRRWDEDLNKAFRNKV